MEIKELVHFYLEKGISSQASDLYVLPVQEGYQLAYRYGAQKREYGQLSHEEGNRFLVYCKYLGDMDIAEKRRVQIGSVELEVKGQPIRLRLSSVGDFRNKESLVIRFLVNRQSDEQFKLFLPWQIDYLVSQMKKSGLYLFSGATGAGKTTAMYHVVSKSLARNKQVITVEDPVEIREPHFLQLQVNEAIGLDYGELLNACLRHRPDILIIGEIRNQITAKLAIRAALTGHLVLATIHGMSKELIGQRFLELGVTKPEVAQTLRGVIFQKLLRRSCPFCVENNCQPDCFRYENGVLFDGNYYEMGQKIKEDDWQKNLRKCWAYGYLSTADYQEELALVTKIKS